MSLLQKTAPVAAPSMLDNQVKRILAAPRQLAVDLVTQWEQAFDTLWRASGQVSVADKLAAIGTDAAELVQRSRDLVEFIIAQLSIGDPAKVDQELIARIMAKVASMPEIVVNPDGTITLAPVVEPEPAPEL